MADHPEGITRRLATVARRRFPLVVTAAMVALLTVASAMAYGGGDPDDAVVAALSDPSAALVASLDPRYDEDSVVDLGAGRGGERVFTVERDGGRDKCLVVFDTVASGAGGASTACYSRDVAERDGMAVWRQNSRSSLEVWLYAPSDFTELRTPSKVVPVGQTRLVSSDVPASAQVVTLRGPSRSLALDLPPTV